MRNSKGNSVLEIFVDKFVKHLSFIDYNVTFWSVTTLVITIWPKVAIKLSHEQLPSMEKQLLWKLQIRTSRLLVSENGILEIFVNSHNSICAGVSF